MRPNRCLADFVAPRGVEQADYAGMFAVSIQGVEKKEAQFLADHDDYSAIMLKALADRLAEAFAERLHQRVRTELWGYAAEEALSNDELIAEKYRGIRPAPGYPACPDHRPKRELFRAARCRAHRHGPDREPGDDAGGQRQRLLPGASRGGLLQCRHASATTSWPIGPRAVRSMKPRRVAHWRRSSADGCHGRSDTARRPPCPVARAARRVAACVLACAGRRDRREQAARGWSVPRWASWSPAGCATSQAARHRRPGPG